MSKFLYIFPYRIIPRTNEKDYIEVGQFDGCWSYLGKTGGKQRLSLDAGWCMSITAIPIHEFMHALGEKFSNEISLNNFTK